MLDTIKKLAQWSSLFCLFLIGCDSNTQAIDDEAKRMSPSRIIDTSIGSDCNQYGVTDRWIAITLENNEKERIIIIQSILGVESGKPTTIPVVGEYYSLMNKDGKLVLDKKVEQ